MTAYEHIDALMLAMPTQDALRAASEQELDNFRSLSNILANIVYLEKQRREAAAH
jgi:hypothetical protein